MEANGLSGSMLDPAKTSGIIVIGAVFALILLHRLVASVSASGSISLG